jgi:hypothetical protein
LTPRVAARRISLATSLYSPAMIGLLEAAREAKAQGIPAFLDGTAGTAEVVDLMGKRSGD